MSLNEIVVETPNVHHDVPQGLQNSKAIVWLIVWYITSGATLFSNKFILSSFNGDALSLGQSTNFPFVFVFQNVLPLGMNQLLISVFVSYVQIKVLSQFSSPNFRRAVQDMFYIGAFRCLTVILGLLALKYIAVSFVATIKASSPLFTVIISQIVLGERTGHWTKFSMLPITIGLALCSSFELSFNLIGFFCALGTNVFEW